MFQILVLWQSNPDLESDLLDYLWKAISGPELHEDRRRFFFMHMVIKAASNGEEVTYSSFIESTLPANKMISQRTVSSYHDEQLVSVLRSLIREGKSPDVFSRDIGKIYKDSLEIAKKLTDEISEMDDDDQEYFNFGTASYVRDYFNPELPETVNHLAHELTDLNIQRGFLNTIAARILLYDPFKVTSSRALRQNEEVLRNISAFDQLLRLIKTCMEDHNALDTDIINPRDISWDKIDLSKITGQKNTWKTRKDGTMERIKERIPLEESLIESIYCISRKGIMASFADSWLGVESSADCPFLDTPAVKQSDLVTIAKNLKLDVPEDLEKEELIEKITFEIGPVMKTRYNDVKPQLTDRWSEFMPIFLDMEKLSQLLSKFGIIKYMFGSNLALPGHHANPYENMFKATLESHRNTLESLFGNLEGYYIAD